MSLIELLVVVVSAASCCSLKKKHQLVLSSSDVNTLIVSLPYIDENIILSDLGILSLSHSHCKTQQYEALQGAKNKTPTF